jgi:hypothetical protein
MTQSGWFLLPLLPPNEAVTHALDPPESIAHRPRNKVSRDILGGLASSACVRAGTEWTSNIASTQEGASVWTPIASIFDFLSEPKKRRSRKLLWAGGTSPFFRFQKKFTSVCVQPISEWEAIGDTPRKRKALRHTKSPPSTMFCAPNRVTFRPSRCISSWDDPIGMVLFSPFTPQRGSNASIAATGSDRTQTELCSEVYDFSNAQHLGLCGTN